MICYTFKHIVNHRTISGVRGVNALAGYKDIAIYTPTMLIAGGDGSDD